MPAIIKIIMCVIGSLFSISIFLWENVYCLISLPIISIRSISDKIKSN